MTKAYFSASIDAVIREHFSNGAEAAQPCGRISNVVSFTSYRQAREMDRILQSLDD
jgi:hypothetical protein